MNAYESIRKIKIGEMWTSNFHGEFLIESQAFTKGSQRYFNIKFLNTGYKTTRSEVSIRTGEIKDYLSKSVYGVGFLGGEGKIDKRVYSVWKGMIGRCYYLKSSSYDNYGRLGVSVSNRWHNYSNFCNDIKNIKGYDENLFYSGSIYLDKDILQRNISIGNRVYSLETCLFVTASENTLEAIQVELEGCVYIFSEKTGLIKHDDIRLFCKENNLEFYDVYMALQGKHKGVRGYIFGYDETLAEKWDSYKKTANKKVIYGDRIYNSVAEASREIGIGRETIRIMSRNNKQYKGKDLRVEFFYD